MLSDKLLDAAIEQFGRHGFDGASTRKIARASGTAMSSITYHFGGKEGLYLASADHIASSIRDLQAPALAIADMAVAGARGEAREALAMLLDSFAQMMLRPKSANWAQFIVREQHNPTAAFERLYDGLMKHVIGTVSALILAARPDLDERTARVMGLLLFGQVLILRVARATVCRVLGTENLDAGEEALLRARLRANVLCIISEEP